MSQSHTRSECRVSSLTSPWITELIGLMGPVLPVFLVIAAFQVITIVVIRVPYIVYLQLFLGVVVLLLSFFSCVIWSIENLNAFLPACTGILKLLRDEYNLIAFLLTLEAPIVTHIQFLPTITLSDQTDRSWELMKWSPKIRCYNVRTNSLKRYRKECMKNSV